MFSWIYVASRLKKKSLKFICYQDVELRLMKEKFQIEIQSFLLTKASLRRKWRWLIPARRWVCLYLELIQRENNERLRKVRQGFVNEVSSLKILKSELNIIVKVKLNCTLVNVTYVCALNNLIFELNFQSHFEHFCQSELSNIKNMIGEFCIVWRL